TRAQRGKLVPEERLQKILSQAGVASRRQAEKIMLEGRVTVNGTVVTELGTKANLETDHIKVDGKLIRAPKNQVYIVLNKPNNTMTTVSDPEGRATVMDLLRGVKERVYPVGRLDYHSEGLLLLTNDGDLANAIMSAHSHLPKTYVVKVTGLLTGDQDQEFRDGIPLSDGRRSRKAEARHQALERVQRRMSQISEILRNARTIAVVGLSGKRYRPSYGVAEYMQRSGYRIIPVNPLEQQVLGETSYPDLDAVPDTIDIVDIFRRPEFVPEIVEAAIRKGAKVIWMQEGVIHEDAARRAMEAGLTVVMDRCILKDHRRLGTP